MYPARLFKEHVMTNPLMRRMTLCLAAGATACAPVLAAPPIDEEGPSVTIYSSADPAGFDPQRFISQQRMGYDPNFAWQVPGFGVVKEIRRLSFKPGLNELRFTDVAQFIDPTTVSFADLTDPATTVLEQNFQFDLINAAKLYEKYIDREIGLEVTRDGQTIVTKGKVLAVNSGLFILQTPAGIEFVQQNSPQIKLPPLPLDGLVTKPTLVWKLNSKSGGEHAVRTTYQTNGITWRSDYNLILNADDTKADLAAWVTLMNLSGAGYNNAKLKLIAGDVQRVQPQGYDGLYAARSMAGRARDESLGFEQKAFFEYHLYTLPRRTDILANTTQQITLFPTATDVPVEKVMVYYGLPQEARWWFFPDPQADRSLGTQSNKKVDVYVRFRNDKESRLGMPLPRGKVRVYKSDDADGTLEFVGEDLIDHTPKDEKVLVKVGQAFDVVGERVQTDFNAEYNAHWIRESIKLQIRNHKDAPVKVIIKENLFRWVNWEIIEKSDPFEKIDARTIHFEVTVPPDGEKTVTYTVRYTW
jgi:hypothetical protein